MFAARAVLKMHCTRMLRLGLEIGSRIEMSMLASGLRGVVSATRRLSGVGSMAMKPSCASAISHAAARPVALAGACRHISGGRAGATSDPPFASLSQTIQAEEARLQAAGPNFNIRVFHFEEALEGLNSNQPLDYVDEVDDLTPLIDLIGPKDEMHMIKRTYQPSVLKKKRTHGFLARLADRNGRKILARRRRKNRARLAV